MMIKISVHDKGRARKCSGLVRRTSTRLVDTMAVVVGTMAVLCLIWTDGLLYAQEVPGGRLNGLTDLLDGDQAVFGLLVNIAGGGNAPLDAMTHSLSSDIDFVMYDMEHGAFDVEALRTYLQFLLNPAALAKAGESRAAAVTKPVIARVPLFAREISTNNWMVKQVLDSGVHGLVLPHTGTPEQVFNLIQAMRFPHPPTTPGPIDLAGTRSGAGSLAAHYWGLSIPQYKQAAGLWRLDTIGNLIPIFMIEDRSGVANVREIARQLKAANVGAVLWAGGTDLGVSYFDDREAVSEALETILAAGKEFGIPVAVNGFANVKEQMARGARVFIAGGRPTPEARAEGGR